MKHYKKSRASYPDGVLAIYDNGGKSADRYTVVYTPIFELPWDPPWFPIVNMSGAPFHPQGVCMHSEYRVRPTRQSGEKCINLDELPEDCQKVIAQDLAEITT